MFTTFKRKTAKSKVRKVGSLAKALAFNQMTASAKNYLYSEFPAWRHSMGELFNVFDYCEPIKWI